MVTVLVLIRVAILRYGPKPLKGLTGITILPVRSRDSRSATVTSNYGRAVTILPTVLNFNRAPSSYLLEALFLQHIHEPHFRRLLLLQIC
jgi:hypothetical protein